MRAQEDFFSDPNWPSSCPLPRVYPKHSAIEAANRCRSVQDPPAKQDHVLRLSLSMGHTQQATTPAVKLEEEQTFHPFILYEEGQGSPVQGITVKIEDISSQNQESDLFLKDYEQELNIPLSYEKEEYMPKSETFPFNKKEAKYQILDKKVKHFLVKQTEFLPVSKVAKMYGVSTNNLFRWKTSCERKIGAGRKIWNIELEGKIISWIEREFRFNGGKDLTRKLIQNKAKEWSSDESFKASKGWLERFVKRNRYLKLHEILDMKLKTMNTESDSDEERPEPEMLFPATEKKPLKVKPKQFLSERYELHTFNSSCHLQPKCRDSSPSQEPFTPRKSRQLPQDCLPQTPPHLPHPPHPLHPKS